MTTAAPNGNALSIGAIYNLPPQYLSTSDYIAPTTIAKITRFDASAMLPLFTSLIVDSLPSLSWTGGGTGGTLIAVEETASMFQWDAYLAASAIAVTFPALPADLGVPMPQGVRRCGRDQARRARCNRGPTSRAFRSDGFDNVYLSRKHSTGRYVFPVSYHCRGDTAAVA
jgi:hypothetical protein